MTLREYLKQYTYLESQIKRMQRKLNYYENNPLKSEHGVVRGSMKNYPYAECHFVVSGPNVKSDKERSKTISQLIVNIQGNKQLFEDMKLDIECFLESTPELKNDLELKEMMDLKYIDRWDDGKIARRFHYDRRTVGKKIDRFLEKYEISHMDNVSHNSHLQNVNMIK